MMGGQAETAPEPGAKERRLLIIDDDALFRDRLARAMERRGFSVETAEAVAPALERAKSFAPDYAVVDLRILGNYDWRLSDANIWKVERVLLDHPHRAIRSSDRRIDALRRRYFRFRREHPGQKPVHYYRGRERWSALPRYLR